MLKFALALLLILQTLHATPPPAQILYKLRQGAVERAVISYKDYKTAKGGHDYALLQQMAIAIIEESSRSTNHDLQLLSLWAAAFSLNPKLLNVLSGGLKKEDPRDILATMFFLMGFPDDRAVAMIKEELNSPWLPIQATAAEFLIQRKEKGILDIVARWLDRVDPRFYPLFVPLFAPSEERFATCWMKKFLHSSDPNVRLMALLEASDKGRDDLLPEIREAARTGNSQDKEAAAFALGNLGDSQSIPLLQELAASKEGEIVLAASYSLTKLGQSQSDRLIMAAARAGNLFAINLLGQLKTGQDLLATLIKHKDLKVRMNATIALLEAKDARALPGLLELLNPNMKSLALVALTSPGHALVAWDLKAHVVLKDLPVTILPRQKLIDEASALPESDFLAFARQAILFEDKEVVPALIWAVKEHDKELLLEQLSRPGAPLARSWATLALYSLKEKGAYAEHVHSWFVDMKKLAIVSVTAPRLESTLKNFHLMTRQESCQLLLAALDTIATSRDQGAIDALLEALIGGNPLNRPVIASLLLRLSE